MVKLITRINWVQNLLSYLIFLLLKLIKASSKWNTINPEYLTKIIKNEKPLIILLWHNQIVGINFCWNKNNKKVYNIATDHPDGILSAKIQSKFGIQSIVRSSKKPTMLYKKLLEIAKRKECIFITPDGPHGPPQQVNGNIYKLVKKLDAEVIFLSFKTDKNIIFNTWDKLRVPKLFSKGYYYWGECIDYKNYEEEEFNKEIIRSLNSGSKKINEYFHI